MRVLFGRCKYLRISKTALIWSCFLFFILFYFYGTYTLEPVCSRNLDAFITKLQSYKATCDLGHLTAHVQNYFWLILDGYLVGYAVRKNAHEVEEILFDKK